MSHDAIVHKIATEEISSGSPRRWVLDATDIFRLWATEPHLAVRCIREMEGAWGHAVLVRFVLLVLDQAPETLPKLVELLEEEL